MGTRQDDRYIEATDQFSAALERLARAYELDPDKRRDLLQEIHFQIWRSFAHYDERCSLRTWVYRVAHHVAASHVLSATRSLSTLRSLEDIDAVSNSGTQLDQRIDLDRLSQWIQQLKPLDRQVIVSYLEDMDAVSIGEITGLSAAAVGMRIHRIKQLLASRIKPGASHAK